MTAHPYPACENTQGGFNRFSTVTFISGGVLNATPHFKRTPDNISNPKVSHLFDNIHPQRARTDMDTGTSMAATAAPHHSGPIEPTARTPPAPVAAPPRAGITSFFFRVHPAYRYRYWYCLFCRGSNPDNGHQYQ